MDRALRGAKAQAPREIQSQPPPYGRGWYIYIDRLRPYIPPLEGDSIPLHYHAPAQIPSERDDRWVIKKILGHKKKGKKLMWKVQWEAGDVTWEKASQFMHGIQSDWAAYDKENNIQVLAEI